MVYFILLVDFWSLKQCSSTVNAAWCCAMDSFCTRTVNQAHSVFGELSAHAGVNGWHDPGCSDGLSNFGSLLRDAAECWAMQNTTISVGFDSLRSFYVDNDEALHEVY